MSEIGDIPVAEAHILSLNRVIDVNRDVKCQQSRGSLQEDCVVQRGTFLLCHMDSAT